MSTEFDRLENKVDKLIDAVAVLAAVQADIKNMNLRMNSHADGIKELDRRTDEIEKKIPLYDDRLKKADWIWKIVAGTIVGAILITAGIGIT